MRVIAATNRDLDKAVPNGSFRATSTTGSACFRSQLPPLRERAEDIPLLVEFLAQRYAAKMGKTITGINRRTMDLLTAYDWPGNIRELQNVIQRAVILGTLTASLRLNPAFCQLTAAVSQTEVRLSLETVERDHISKVLHETNWVVEGPGGAATILGLHPNTLRNRLKKLKIECAAHRPR